MLPSPSGLPTEECEGPLLDRLPVAPGVVLRTARWAAPAGGGTGSVLLLQGQSEFVEKYIHIAAGLRRRGLAVYSFDWRGQGGSTRMLHDRRRGHIADFERYLEDLDAVRRHLLADARQPLYLLAHSLGGHLALRWLHDHSGDVRAALLVAPMLGFATGAWPGRLARALARVARRRNLGALMVPGRGHLKRRRRIFAGNPYTSDERMHAWMQTLMRRHPELVVEGVTIGWLAAAYDSLAVLHAPSYAQAIATPLTLLLAGDERVVDNAAARAFAARLPHARVLELHGARHELMLERPAVLEAFWAAVDERFGMARTSDQNPMMRR